MSKHLNVKPFFGVNLRENKQNRTTEKKIIMKTIKIITGLFLGVTLLNAQPTIQSYASTSPALEASLSGLDNRFEVPDTAVTSVILVSFASKIDFPVGTTSAVINSISFSLIKKVAGIEVPQLTNISMNGSSWNNEGGTSSPHLYVRDTSNNLVAMTGVLMGNSIPNAKTLFITKHNINLGSGPFEKMVQEGDFYKLTRSINVSWTVSGVPQTTTLTTESTVMIWFYPTNPPKITSTSTPEGGISFNVVGATLTSYGNTWWMETSTDLGISNPWTVDNGGVVTGNTIVTFPVNVVLEPKRFWRIKYTPNPSPNPS
jgi:hypothetical protein